MPRTLELAQPWAGGPGFAQWVSLPALATPLCVQEPRDPESHTDTPFRAAGFLPLCPYLASLSPLTPPPHSQAPGMSQSLMMVSRFPHWPQGPSGHLTLTQGPLGAQGGSSLGVGEVGRTCHGEKETEQCSEGFPCSLSLLLSSAPFQRPGPLGPNPCSPQSWDLPGAHAYPFCRAQRLRTSRPALGRLGAPWTQQNPHTLNSCCWRPCPRPRSLSQQPGCPDKPQNIHGPVSPLSNGTSRPPTPTPGDEKGAEVP